MRLDRAGGRDPPPPTSSGERASSCSCVAPDGPVSRLLELTNLKQHFTVYSDRDDAISAAAVAAS
jgi:hypothetical protein